MFIFNQIKFIGIRSREISTSQDAKNLESELLFALKAIRAVSNCNNRFNADKMTPLDPRKEVQ